MPAAKRPRTATTRVTRTQAGKVDISVNGKVYAIDVLPRDVRLETLLAEFYAAHLCRKCGKNKGSVSMPCPYCQKSAVPPVAVVRPAAVRVKYVRVPSATTEGMWYTLECTRIGKTVLRCSCPGFKYRKSCHHKTDYEGGK